MKVTTQENDPLCAGHFLRQLFEKLRIGNLFIECGDAIPEVH